MERDSIGRICGHKTTLDYSAITIFFRKKECSRVIVMKADKMFWKKPDLTLDF